MNARPPYGGRAPFEVRRVGAKDKAGILDKRRATGAARGGSAQGAWKKTGDSSHQAWPVAPRCALRRR